jgi:hypothetical protein
MDKLKTPICVYQTFKGSLSHLSALNLTNFEIDALNLTFGQIYGLKPAVELFD